MANKLFQDYGSMGSPQKTNPIAQFLQFKNSFRGNDQDAQNQIQQMLNDGRLSQEQYNNAVQKANWLASLLGKH